MICYWVLYKYNSDLAKSRLVYIEDSCPIRDIPEMLERQVSEQVLSSASDASIKETRIEIVDFKLMFCA